MASTSYAYDPSGKKVEVKIVDGKSYLSDGSRIPSGYTVQTGGGIYKMTDSGGVKVDSHNAVEKKTSGSVAKESTGSGATIDYTRPEQPTGYTKVGDTYIINRNVYADDPKDSFTGSNYDFTQKYDAIIRKIAAANNVDMSVGEEMLKTNLEHNKSIYSGGGVIPTEQWNEMLNDYRVVKTNATIATNDPRSYTRDAYGKEISTADVLKRIEGNVEGEYRAYPEYANLGQNLSGMSNAQLAQTLQGMMSGTNSYGTGGSGGNGVTSVKPAFQLPDAPQLRSANSMANHLDINYDQDYIRELMEDAVNKKYANLDKEFGRTQDIYYDAIANNADMLSKTLRRGDREAVMSGMASGTQAALDLGMALETSKQGAQGATELAQGRSDLVNQREAEIADVAVQALKYYNDLGLNLGQLSSSELNALVTAYASKVATLGGVYNTDVLADVERDRMTSAEKIAAIQAMANKDVANITADYNRYIADSNSSSSKYATDANSALNKYLASIKPTYTGGSSSGGNTDTPTTPSNYEVAAILWGLYEETGDIGYLKQVAEIYGVPWEALAKPTGGTKELKDTLGPNVEITDVLASIFGKDNGDTSYWGGRPQAQTPDNSKPISEWLKEFVISQRNRFPMAGSLDFNK